MFRGLVDLIKKYGQDTYDFRLRETQTYEIIEDVAHMRSEIGILFLNDFNESVLRKLLKSHELEFHELFVAKPHVFISRRHPLADESDMHIGYITHRKSMRSLLEEAYLNLLTKYFH